jgi:hypothetical protein
MFGNNGHRPILSEKEIKFLLSDWPIPDNSSLRLRSDETNASAEASTKDTTANDLFTTIRDSR